MKKKIAYLLVAATLACPAMFTTGCAVAQKQTTAGNYAKDKEITARIKTAMYGDPTVKGTQVKVTSLNGVVQLSGFVDSQAAKDRAGQLASETPGVVKVFNNIVLPTGR